MSCFPRAGVGALYPKPLLLPHFLPPIRPSSHRQLALHAFCAACTLGLAKRLARGVPVCARLYVCRRVRVGVDVCGVG